MVRMGSRSANDRPQEEQKSKDEKVVERSGLNSCVCMCVK